jgi:hypothetical protein
VDFVYDTCGMACTGTWVLIPCTIPNFFLVSVDGDRVQWGGLTDGPMDVNMDVTQGRCTKEWFPFDDPWDGFSSRYIACVDIFDNEPDHKCICAIQYGQDVSDIIIFMFSANSGGYPELGPDNVRCFHTLKMMAINSCFERMLILCSNL